MSDEVFCHRKCYSEFTHQKQIKTFEARVEGQKVDVESPKQEHKILLLTENVEILNNLSLLEV
jgi:hypothetical protein